MDQVRLDIVGRYSTGSKRVIYSVCSGIPVIGLVFIGAIDRGTNVIQVRPTTLCPLNCIFCSVDSGPFSTRRWAEFIVEPNTILETVSEILRYKRGPVEALIDTVGDPLTYPYLAELISRLKSTPRIRSVAIETHGALLSYRVIRRLEESGLDRINLSIDTLDEEKARLLQGVKWYSVKRVKELAEYIVESTDIDLHVTPVWIPGVNDGDVIDVAKWAIRIGAGKRWPPVTIQKYVVHKYGRKVPGVKPVSWSVFWRRINELEKKLGARLRWSMSEWGMSYDQRIPCPYRRRGIIAVEIVSRGLFKGEFIGVTLDDKKRFVTVYGWSDAMPERVYVELIDVRDCILVGKVRAPL